MQKKVLLYPVAFALWVGCASMHPNAQTEVSYTHPAAAPVENAIVINRPFEDAWNGIIRNLTASYYRINQVEKASRIINLDLDTTEAGRYVDCGRMLHRITFKNQTSEFDYPVASDDYYEMAYADRWIYWFEITPKTTLTGSINLYLSPVDERRTEVTVNVRYDVVKDHNAVEYTRREDGKYRTDDKHGRALDPSRWTFTTREPSRPDYDGGPFCVSKGVIEEEILAFARR